MCHRYANAKQYRRAKKQTKFLCTYVGRVRRDIERQLSIEIEEEFTELFKLSETIIFRTRNYVSPNERIYSIHEPETECITKGKVNKKHEFGHKVSITSTNNKNFILSCITIPGNPYDGHTLTKVIADVQGAMPELISVDLGYRGNHIREIKKALNITVVHPRLKNVSVPARRLVRKRSKVESVISLLKRCYRMSVSYLKGVKGAAVNAILAGATFNFAKLLRHYKTA